MIERALSPVALVGLALCLASAPACSGSADANPAKSATQQDKRDTTIVHEPCDGKSASARGIDINGDGKNDITHVMNGDKEVCRIADLNLDGFVDVFIYYDANGKERRRESDFDRDGRADEIAIYENGVLKLKLRETNFDNKIDTWDYYENDRLVRRERDSDGDGIVDQWWNFNNPQNPKCAIVASDRNADGKPDPESVVDLCGEAYGAPKVAPAAPPGSASAAAPPAPPPGAPPASAAPPPPPPAPPPPPPPQPKPAQQPKQN